MSKIWEQRLLRPLMKDQKSFEDNVRHLYGDKYELSQSVYAGVLTPLKVMCPEHGEFEITPEAFIHKGQECPQCKPRRDDPAAPALDPQEYLYRVRSMHPDWYDYTDSIYLGSKKPFTFRCQRHGKNVTMLASAHLAGQGCPDCTRYERSNKVRSRESRVFAECEQARPGVFTYYPGSFETVTVPMKVMCNKHQQLCELSPTSIKKGSGCPTCVQEAISTKAYERSMAKVRGYVQDNCAEDYTPRWSTFTDMTNKMDIDCLHCGNMFSMRPYAFLRGQGCPKCGHKRKGRSMDTATFISKMRSLDYSNLSFPHTVFVDWDTPVQIHCSHHGDISYQPRYVYTKQNCPHCEKDHRPEPLYEHKVRSLEDFLREAKAKFGDRFDYSRIKSYESVTSAVPIRCPEHGPFEMVLRQHLKSSHGCPECAKRAAGESRVKDRGWFTALLRERYGDNITLPEDSTYVNATTPVTVECARHGRFSKAPTLFKKTGCWDCGQEEARRKKKECSAHSLQDRSNAIHGEGLYRLDPADYADMKQKMRIYCTRHEGYFEQTPDNHLQGYGCHICGNAVKGQTRVVSFQQWKDSLRERREDKGEFYDYDKAKQGWKNTSTAVTLRCPRHDVEFEQDPNNHRNGAGCPLCASEKRPT